MFLILEKKKELVEMKINKYTVIILLKKERIIMKKYMEVIYLILERNLWKEEMEDIICHKYLIKVLVLMR